MNITMPIEELFQLFHLILDEPDIVAVPDPEPDDDPTPPAGIDRAELERLTDDYINDLVMWVRANGGMGQFTPHIVAMATLHAWFRQLYDEQDLVGCTDAALALKVRGLFADAAGAVELAAEARS